MGFRMWGDRIMQVGSFVLNMVIPCSNILMVKIATDGSVKVLYQGSSDTIENNVDLFNRYKISYLTAKGDKLLLYVKEC